MFGPHMELLNIQSLAITASWAKADKSVNVLMGSIWGPVPLQRVSKELVTST